MVEVAPSLAQGWKSHIRLIAVGIGLHHILHQRKDGLLRRHEVGTSDAKTDDRQSSIGIHSGHFLELAAEVVFFDVADTVGRLDLFHTSISIRFSVYSPRIIKSVVKGMMASSALR